MICPKELRIGNLVLYNEEITKIDGVSFKTVDLFYNETVSITKSIELISPVLLTEEILLKCGFEKGIDEGYTFSGCILRKKGDEYEYSIPCSTIAIAHIKYLHHLQNLYFSLSNSDLKLKDDSSGNTIIHK